MELLELKALRCHEVRTHLVCQEEELPNEDLQGSLAAARFHGVPLVS